MANQLGSAEDLGAAGNVLTFNTVNVQGVNLVEQDVSGKNYLTLDVGLKRQVRLSFLDFRRCSSSTRGTGEIFDVTAGAWNTLTIDLTTVTGST